jgi:hypothetical protein
MATLRISGQISNDYKKRGFKIPAIDEDLAYGSVVQMYFRDEMSRQVVRGIFR